MSASLLKCPRCQLVLGNLTGPFFTCSYAHRDVVLRGLSVIVCPCGCDFSPLPIGQRDTRSVEQIIAAAREKGSQPLRCPAPDCGKVLAEIGGNVVGGSGAGGVVIIKRQRRVIVGRELLFTNCHACRRAVEPPFTFPASTRPSACAPISPLEGALTQ